MASAYLYQQQLTISHPARRSDSEFSLQNFSDEPGWRPLIPWTMKIFSPKYVTKVKGHGRIEVRKIRTSTALNDYVTIPYVAQVFRIERITYKLNGELLRQEVAYGITSLPPEKADAKRLLSLNCGHWCIENRLHWVRDVTFDEDRSQIRTGQRPRAMATLRNLAISLFRLHNLNNIAQALRSCSRKPERALQLLGL